eukprot:TRINITY_DN1041_c0_g1_i2.p1 TRINITY_DN1041_c0_g1~~TRINITY_DN1041_c0_g1_i2.p1  ORF type:complete len:337 (+),score=30.76 TRINITY_DN1041_c0_g1_i2:133-1143(+)
MSAVDAALSKLALRTAVPEPSQRSRKITNDFQVFEVLGRGSFSTVRRVRHKKDGYFAACKIIDKALLVGKMEAIQTETEILRAAQHPNITCLLDVYEDEHFVYLIMELMEGGDLFERICADYPSGYSEREAAAIARSMLLALEYLHSHGICHRDLKPENLLFKSPKSATGVPLEQQVKISDFGLARIKDDGALMKTACGSPNYVAPEVLAQDPKGYGTACDMWSFGVILYVLLCGFCPFYHENISTLFRLICDGSYSFPSPYWDNVSAEAKDLVTKLLVVSPAQRLTPPQALQHPWFAKSQTQTANVAIGSQLRRTCEQRATSRVVLGSDAAPTFG